MAKYKVVFLGLEDDKLEYEQAEMADLDVEFRKQILNQKVRLWK